MFIFVNKIINKTKIIIDFFLNIIILFVVIQSYITTSGVFKTFSPPLYYPPFPRLFFL